MIEYKKTGDYAGFFVAESINSPEKNPGNSASGSPPLL
jgi:hypothetical protein